MAVVAGFFRRGVVVDIINWPVLYILSLARKAPQVGDECPQPYLCGPLVQTFAAIANGTSTTEYQFLNSVASLSRSLIQKTGAKVNKIIPGGEKHEHRHQGKSDSKADFLGFFAQRTPANRFNGIEQKMAAIQ